MNKLIISICINYIKHIKTLLLCFFIILEMKTLLRYYIWRFLNITKLLQFVEKMVIICSTYLLYMFFFFAKYICYICCPYKKIQFHIYKLQTALSRKKKRCYDSTVPLIIVSIWAKHGSVWTESKLRKNNRRITNLKQKNIESNF